MSKTYSPDEAANLILAGRAPAGLTVGGSLYLCDCTGLTSLPEVLAVGGSLNFRGCTVQPGVYGTIVVPKHHSDGKYTVTGHIVDGSIEIRAGCFRGSVEQAIQRARGREEYLVAIREIEEMWRTR